MIRLINEAEQLGASVEKVRADAQQGDLALACELFYSVLHAADERLSAAWSCRHGDRAQLSSSLETARSVLAQRLTDALNAASAELTGDLDASMGRAFALLRLFILIGEREAGLVQLSGLVHLLSRHSLHAIAHSSCKRPAPPITHRAPSISRLSLRDQGRQD